ncbi:MAG: lytic transglycosylase domain-containing protein [Acidobacteriota bacterium]|jgi:hypothetical protein
MAKDNSLIQKGFSDTMRRAGMSPIYFSLCLVAMAAQGGWSADTELVRTTVRVDRGSGRLVRTQLVLPREVPPVEVIARERSATVVSPVQLKTEVEQIVEKAAAEHGVDPMLVRSVMQVESNFNPNALSPKGAMGLMQLMPGTARQLGVTNAFDVRQNIEGGVKYLRYLKEKFMDDRLVLAAYNAGEGAVKKHGWIPPYPETIEYVYRVGRKYGEAKLKQPAAPLPPPEKAQPRIVQFVDAEGRIHITMP